MKAISVLPFLLLAAFAGSAAAQAIDETDMLGRRLQALEMDPATSGFAQLERLQARQAIDAYVNARARDRDALRQVAGWRVDTAETAARSEALRREIDRLDRTRADLLVEASRQEAARARAEAERLRIQAQIQAEETARLRAAADSELTARQQAETVLEGVASDQAAKLRAARARDAELARREAELLRQAEQDGD
ncbi:hypothetical protein E4582_11295 [Luteimonas yindakuii]|uniref:DUF4398 domain-containing protein n=1 Tax=Luteimonas yindakuii TaxID=2565782 RepID=A0A4Z1R865_9GAMM|nr:hypothetical protein [Luteimonas yindakuii]TKS52818.1 hypothetical protein E4582_11295 [Luteimonas yindakuii]